jgi:menaquinone-dependent protoporphyrinogen oxidase
VLPDVEPRRLAKNRRRAFSESKGGADMTVLVAAASRHGGTEGIAKRIGDDLIERGFDVEVRRPQDVSDVNRYEAVVLGSAIYLGNWMKEARSFVEANADELAEMPTWLFASGSITGDPPVADDPNAIRPSVVEKLVSSTHAREHKLFAGRLDSSTLSLSERLPVRMARGREGDWRDWQDIDEWAGSIARELGRERAERSNG